MKKVLTVCILLCIIACFTACSGTNSERSSSTDVDENGTSSEENVDNSRNEEPQIEEDEYFTKFDINTKFDNRDTKIVFEDGKVTVEGTGVRTEGTTATVIADGTYVISGKCSDGQIIVSVAKTEKVRLVLNGIDLTSKTSAPIWVKQCDKASVSLAKGTVNVLTDGNKYTFDNIDEEPNACIFSKDDLTINGEGTLTVNGNFNNGICSKDDLKIVSGNISVNAKNNALKGNDSVSIRGGNLELISADDGIKTTNTNKPEKGFIYIRNGVINITAGDDAIQATKAVTIVGGKITTYAEGDSVNCKGNINIAEDCVVVK